MFAAAAVVGAVVGAFAGINFRRNLAAQTKWPDMVGALLEDAVAIISGLVIVSRV